VKKILKILSYTVLGLVAFVVLLAGLTQTQFFRDRLRTVALSNLDSLLDAEVQLGELQGNLVTGFSLNGISIKVGGEFLLIADRIDLRYNLFEIPGKVISVDDMTFVRPSVSLLRSRDGVWNFKRMMRPKPEDTTGHQPFDWVILINKLEIQNGTLILVDSAALTSKDHPPQDPHFVEYHNFALEKIHLVTSAQFKKEEKHATISVLSFLSDSPEIRLERLSGEFQVTPTASSVKNLAIKTGRSYLQLDAEMQEFDLLGGIELSALQNSPVQLSLHAHDIDLDELKQFIPQIDFLNGALSTDLEAGGEFGELNLKRLDLMTGQTSFHFSGAVFNLHHPRNLMLNVKCTESKLYSPDALALLPTFNLPDYQQLGVTTLNLEFEGKPLDFRTKFYLETAAGNVHSDIALKIGGPKTLAYKGEVLLQDIDLAKVVPDEKLASRVNALINIDGEGTSVDNLMAAAKVRIDSSEFMGRPVGPSTLALEAKERKFSISAAIAYGPMRSTIEAELDEQIKATPSFKLEGRFASLNLEDLLHEKSLNSDLTMTAKVQGSGLSLDKLNGDCQLDFSESRFGDYEISSGNVHLLIDQHNPQNKQLKLESNIADFSLTGAFDAEYLGRLLTYELQNLRGAINEKFSLFDSAMAKPLDRKAFDLAAKKLAASSTALDAAFSLRLKDLEPISLATGNRTFNGVGVLNGSLKGNYENLAVHADLELDDFFYGNVDAGLLIQGGSAVLDLNSLKPTAPLKDIDIRCEVIADRMHVNREEFDSLHTTITYQDESAKYTARAILNRDLRLFVQGKAKVSEDEVVFGLNDVQFAYQDLLWKSDGVASVGFKRHGMRVRDLSMRRDSQTVSLSGDLSTEGALSARLTASKIDLDDLKYLLSKDELTEDRQAFAGVLSLSVVASGTLDRPEYTCSLRADDVSYRTVPFGEITGSFSYAMETLTSSVEIRSGASRDERLPSLSVAGTLPINLSLAKVDERFPDKPMDLTIKSSGIQMSVLDPLLPTFNELTGIMRCDVKLVGSPRKPTYQGRMSIDSCRFLFVPNNIYYTLQGMFQPDGERIKVQEATIRNLSTDKRFGREGSIKIAGDFAFREFKPSDFNLTAKGQLLVVKETTRKSSLSVYGNLFVEIGPDGLHYTGTIDNSQLKGYVLISNSSLVFPPTQGSTVQASELSIPIAVIDDTTKATPVPERPSEVRYFGAQAVGPLRPVSINNTGLPTKSFLDGVHYDLVVESSGGNTEIRMIFFTATGEELAANISGKVSITEDGKRWIGDMTVDRASYNFYKRFEADGKLRYTGDFLNPELDIKAEYQGTRTRQDSSKTEKVIVNLKITGTRREPKLDISMTIDDIDYYSYSGLKSADVNSDAIQFLIAGTFPLTQSQKNDIALTIGSTVGASLVTGATSLLTSNLSDFLRRETGFINSIEFSYGSQGSFGESADIRVSGVAAGGLWRYGGKILNDPFSNANVSILYSFGNIFNRPSLRNFMFELERRVETSTIGQVRAEINSARLFYRFSF
jgi:hypothetical protein